MIIGIFYYIIAKKMFCYLEFNDLVIFRIMNLELMEEYGAEAWKEHNALLQRMLTHSQAQLQDLK